jgi:hypothetical protein
MILHQQRDVCVCGLHSDAFSSLLVPNEWMVDKQ